MKARDFDANELERFRAAQRLAYACAEEVARELDVGMSEREAARRLDTALRRAGVRTHFHRPFAWFGDRTAFRGFRTDLAFFPSRRKLERGMPVILDVAPVVDGFAADIGYSISFGENRVQACIREDLVACRSMILERVRARASFRAIYAEVDRFLLERGYESAHRIYPERVLAHRLGRVSPSLRSRLHVFGFGVDQLEWLVPGLVRGRLAPARGASPLWNDGPESAHPPLPGLWAVEPHFAFGGVGAKWEEILVVTEDDAYWLDDDVPHVREAEARGWLPRAHVPVEVRS